MLAAKEEGNLLKFGSRIPMVVALPTNDMEKAKNFLSKTEYIVENTWMKGKQTNIGGGKFLLQFITLPIGFDTITPEIEVEFLYDPEYTCIRMKSGSWQLKGKEGTVKDSRFMQTFQINLEGVLTAVPPTSDVPSSPSSSVMVDGWVRYEVKGEKPSFFRLSPQFILDNTIGFIQSNVERFAYKEFTGRLLRAFKAYDAAEGQVQVLGQGQGQRAGGLVPVAAALDYEARLAEAKNPSRNLNARERYIAAPPPVPRSASYNPASNDGRPPIKAR